MSRKHKKVCITLNYIQNFLILASAITGCILITAFPSLLGISIGITSSAIGLNIRAIAAATKMYKSIMKKMKKNHAKIVSLVKSKLNSIKALTSKALINSNTSHDKFVLINNMLKEYNDMKEENLKT